MELCVPNNVAQAMVILREGTDIIKVGKLEKIKIKLYIAMDNKHDF